MLNKKGLTTLGLIVIIFISFILLVSLGVVSWAISLADDQISSLDFLIGNQSFNDTYQQIMKPSMDVLSVNGPKIISIATMIGMVLVLIFVAMKSPKKSRLWILVDIFIIIISVMIAVAIKTSFEDSILNLTPELFEIFTTTLAEGSKWILNLPTIVGTLGALIIIATYVLKREDEEEQTGGFIQIENQ